MRTLFILCAFSLLLMDLPAQTKYSLVTTGRFDSISLDPNGGSLNRIREFDLSIVTPGPGAAARSWLPTTTLNALWGDAHADGNYTRFDGWKAYYDQFNFASPFVKSADMAKGDPRLVYMTIRDKVVNKVFKVFTKGGTATYQILPGDFFRFLPGGNLEFFITQSLFAKAAGKQTGSFKHGASALCQDAKGNLYYSPAEGGHWVAGVYLYDGSIAMIKAADITYDTQGNVQDVKAGSAIGIMNEIGGSFNVRSLVANSGARDTNGNAYTITANMVGLCLDPGSGTFFSGIPDPVTQKPFMVPNLLFTFDNGTMAGTIFSTANYNSQPGSIAVINGVTMGNQTGIPDASYVGCKPTPKTHTPTFMGIALIEEVKEVFTADAPNDGAILSSHQNIQVDVGYLAPNTPLFLLLGFGPVGSGKKLDGFDLTPVLGLGSYGWVYTFMPPIFGFGLGLSNTNGYAQFQVPKPTDPALIGANLIFHAAKMNKSMPNISLSNPVLMQFK